MKSFIFPSLAFFISLLFLHSCGFVEETTSTPADSPEGRQKAYILQLDDTDAGMAKKVWAQYIRSHKSRIQRIKRSDVEMARSVDIAGLSGDIDVKSNFVDYSGTTEMQLWFVKNNKYLTPDQDRSSFDAIDRFIDNYFAELEKAQIEEAVKGEKDKLKKLEKELDNLRKNNDKLHRDISKYEDRIKEARIQIEDNLREQDVKNQEIQQQKQIVDRTKSKNL